MRMIPHKLIGTWWDAISEHRILGSLATAIIVISLVILFLALKYWWLNLSFTFDRLSQWETDSIVLSDVDPFPNQVIVGDPAGTKVGIQAKWADPEETDSVISYSLDDDAGGRFRIGPKTGIVRVADGSRLDSTKMSTHTVTVRVEAKGVESEGKPPTQSRTQEFTISVYPESRSFVTCLAFGDPNETATDIVPAASASTEEADQAASEQVPSCLAPSLVDLSTVSPTLVAVTAFFTMIGAFILISFMARESIPEDGWTRRYLLSVTFPFLPRYRTYYVQLGLIGTIVGFVIAFNNLDPQARNTGALVDALGTALWSTLIALILAYVVCALAIETIFQWVRKQIPGWVPPDKTVRETIDDLKNQAAEVADKYRTLKTTTEALTMATKDLTTATQTLKTELGVETMRKNMKELRDDVTQLSKDASELRQTLQQSIRASSNTANKLDDNTKKMEDTKSALTTLVISIAGLTHKLRNIFK